MENKFTKNFCASIPLNPFSPIEKIKTDEKNKEIVIALYTAMREKVLNGEWNRKNYETVRSSIVILDEKFLRVNYATLVSFFSLSNEEAKIFTRYYDQVLSSHLFETKYFPVPGDYHFIMKNKPFSPNDCVLLFKEIYSRLVLVPSNQLAEILLEHKSVDGVFDFEVIDEFLARIESVKQSLRQNADCLAIAKEYYWKTNQKYLDTDYLNVMLGKMEPLFLERVLSRLESKYKKGSFQRVLANQGEIELHRYEKSRYGRLIKSMRHD